MFSFSLVKATALTVTEAPQPGPPRDFIPSPAPVGAGVSLAFL